MRAHRIKVMDRQQAPSEENDNMCAVNINRFLETARQHLLDEVAGTVEFSPVSESTHQAN
jgi:hypothetical protein